MSASSPYVFRTPGGAPSPERRIFRDEALDQTFYRQGYVILPLFDAEVLEGLARFHEGSDPGVPEGFFSSTHCPNTDYRDAGDKIIREACVAAIMAQVIDYQVLVANYLIKKPGERSALPLHQDWMMVDESRFSSINVWFPVRPVTPENGPLCVLPGSHRFMPGLRGSLWYATPLNALRDEIRDNYMVTLDVPLGHAVFMDSALVHFSPANLTYEQRIAACLNIAPQEAQLVHYFFDHEANVVEKYDVDARFFLTTTLGKRPEYSVVETISQYQAPDFSQKDLHQILGIETVEETPASPAPSAPPSQPAQVEAPKKAWWARLFS